MFSQDYVHQLSIGPFPNQIDPWSETARYFHQILGCIISDLLERLRLPLLRLGYIAARETSLQIAERVQPDVAIRNPNVASDEISKWDYAAAGVMLEPGINIEDATPELEAIKITQIESRELVTVIEVISPSNKDLLADMEYYQHRRDRLVKDKGINVVEIDLTRSIKRLVRDLVASTYPYHFAIHMPYDAWLIGWEYGEALKSFALPLRNEVIPIETQAVYQAAYQQASIAPQIEATGGYVEGNLPFPSLMTSAQRKIALEQVNRWQAKLADLRTER